MNIICFPTGTTNIFPIANSHLGGQLPTEFNMRSREGVETNSTVKYHIGPSYTHSLDDFKVTMQLDGSGNEISSSAIQIAPGRAVINGHYFESLAPINIDLLYCQMLLKKSQSSEKLDGKISVGLKAMYSTEKTIAGSMYAEDENKEYYEGVHVVILPEDKFKLPEDCPENENRVTAHLLLATFQFTNGSVLKDTITQNADRVHSIDAERIGNFDSLLENSGYASITGLDPYNLYVMAGMGARGTKAQWDNANSCLYDWESPAEVTLLNEGDEGYDEQYDHAAFIYESGDIDTDYQGNNRGTSSDKVKLVLPHHHGANWTLLNSGNEHVRYKNCELELPAANYGKGLGGVITRAFIEQIKTLDRKITMLHHVPGGRLRAVIPILTSRTPPSDSKKIDDPVTAGTLSYLPRIAYDVRYGTLNTAVLDEQETQFAEFNAKLGALQEAYDTVLENYSSLKSDIESDLKGTLQSYIDTESSTMRASIISQLSDYTLESRHSADVKTLEASIEDVKEVINGIEDGIKHIHGNKYKRKNQWYDIEDTDWEATSDISDDKAKAAIVQLQEVMADLQSNVLNIKHVVKWFNTTNNLSEGDKLSDIIEDVVENYLSSDIKYNYIETLWNKITNTAGYPGASDRLEGIENKLNTFINTTWPAYVETINSQIQDKVDKSIAESFDGLFDGRLDKIKDAVAGALENYGFTEGNILQWNRGDYILVLQDQTVGSPDVNGRYPSTAYCVVPGKVAGVELSGSYTTEELPNDTTTEAILNTALIQRMPQGLLNGGVLLAEAWVGQEAFDTVSTSAALQSLIDFTLYNGSKDIDYFALRCRVDVGSKNFKVKSKYFVVKQLQKRFEWSDPIWLTGNLFVATEEVLGGVRSVPPEYIGQGYITVDDNGFMKLIDYDLLSTGVLAYQLGEDFETTKGQSFDQIQSQLDQYVNDRVAFIQSRDSERVKNWKANAITITLNLSTVDASDTGPHTITIRNIDSRFDTHVYLIIQGSYSDNTIINIENCEKIRINNLVPTNDTSQLAINLYNSCLYYDSGVLDSLLDISGLSLWYEPFERTDPKLTVEGMTVRITDTTEYNELTDFYSETLPNDTRFAVGLRSLSFSTAGMISGIQLNISCPSTNTNQTPNLRLGKGVYAKKWTLKGPAYLPVPTNRLRKPIKVSGSFVVAYPYEDTGYLVTQQITFTALSNYRTFDQNYNYTDHEGTLSFLSDVSQTPIVDTNIDHTSDSDTEPIKKKIIDGWSPNKGHPFFGGITD